MKQFTNKHLESLERDILKIEFKLQQICEKKISDRVEQLNDEGWNDYDGYTQESLVNQINNLTSEVSNISFLLNILITK